jgi:hypothetical protein
MHIEYGCEMGKACNKHQGMGHNIGRDGTYVGM